MTQQPPPEPGSAPRSAAPPPPDPAGGSRSSPRAAQPHDGYFRACLAERAEQAALVGLLFPQLASALAGEEFEALDGTFVDEELRHTQSDILLRTRLREREVLVYALVEHQSTVDRLMAVRMLRYQTRIWERFVAGHPDTSSIPAILPAVIYHGDRAWTAATDLRDLIDLDSDSADDAEPYLVRAPYRLEDLTRVDPSTLRGRVTPPLYLTLVVLGRVNRHTDVPAFLQEHKQDLAEVAAGDNALRHFHLTFTYIVSVTDVAPGQLRQLATDLGPVALEALMTTADLLRAEGRAEGRTEGRAEGRTEGRTEGRAELLLRQMNVKFGPLEESVRTRITTATDAQLDIWAERILTGATIAEVIG